MSEWARMRAPAQEGDFPFPVKYGYAAVGVVEDGPSGWPGRTVFALHPHQDRFVLPVDRLALVPETVPPERAVLAANMETALNALWDGGAGPAERILVIGAGVVGLLVARLAARLPGAEVTVVDIDAGRADIVRALGATFVAPDAAPRDVDLVFHASASGDGLALALGCAGLEARIVELSWHGDRAVELPLGGAFHSRRLTLLSSQVGQVSPGRRPRWTHGRRLEAALGLLDDPALDALPFEEVLFDDLPDALPRLLAPGAPGLGARIRYR